MEVRTGDYCILKGAEGFDICVRVVRNLEPWEGAPRFMGEKLTEDRKKVIVRRAFFKHQILKIIPSKGSELGLSENQSLA